MRSGFFLSFMQPDMRHRSGRGTAYPRGAGLPEIAIQLAKVVPVSADDMQLLIRRYWCKLVSSGRVLSIVGEPDAVPA